MWIILERKQKLLSPEHF